MRCSERPLLHRATGERKEGSLGRRDPSEYLRMTLGAPSARVGWRADYGRSLCDGNAAAAAAAFVAVTVYVGMPNSRFGPRRRTSVRPAAARTPTYWRVWLMSASTARPLGRRTRAISRTAVSRPAAS